MLQLLRLLMRSASCLCLCWPNVGGQWINKEVGEPDGGNTVGTRRAEAMVEANLEHPPIITCADEVPNPSLEASELSLDEGQLMEENTASNLSVLEAGTLKAVVNPAGEMWRIGLCGV